MGTRMTTHTRSMSTRSQTPHHTDSHWSVSNTSAHANAYRRSVTTHADDRNTYQQQYVRASEQGEALKRIEPDPHP